MLRRLVALLGLAAGVAAVGLVRAVPVEAAPLRVGYSTWVGYGPLFLARDKGFLKEATDTLIFRRNVIESRAPEIAAIARGWDHAVKYWMENKAGATEMMSTALGSWLKDPVFAETLAGVRYYTLADNQKFLGTPARPGPILSTARNSVEIWGELGKLQGTIDPKATINWTAVGR